MALQEWWWFRPTGSSGGAAGRFRPDFLALKAQRGCGSRAATPSRVECHPYAAAAPASLLARVVVEARVQYCAHPTTRSSAGWSGFARSSLALAGPRATLCTVGWPWPLALLSLWIPSKGSLLWILTYLDPQDPILSEKWMHLRCKKSAAGDAANAAAAHSWRS